MSFHKVITDSKHVYVVLNLCDGGDLFSAITERNLYFGNDALIKSVFLQILDAVHHCHSKGVYHRDLKPENIFCSKDGATMYIGDFGLATDKEITKDYGCGSKFYMSPGELPCSVADIVADLDCFRMYRQGNRTGRIFEREERHLVSRCGPHEPSVRPQSLGYVVCS